MLNSTVSDFHMNIPGIDSNNHKDMANAINTKFVSVSSHIEPLNIYTPQHIYLLMTYPLLCILGRFTKILRLSNHLKPVVQTLSDFWPLFAGVPQGTKLGP